MNTPSNRHDKIVQFMLNGWGNYRLHWCTAKVCGCMGGINCSEHHKWKSENPSEAPISKDEFDTAIAFMKVEYPKLFERQTPIRIEFKGINR